MKLGMRAIFVLVMIISSSVMWLSSGKQGSTPQAENIVAKEEPNDETEENPVSKMEITPVQVQIERASGSISLDMETYLQGVVGSEMPANFEIEALKAQAVAARTFACKREFNVDDTTSSQVYHDNEQLKEIWKDNYDQNAEKIKVAIDATKGEVMKYQGACITAAFFSSSNGATNNAEDYWQDEVPYLKSVDSPWDLEVENNSQTITISAEEFANQLGFQNIVSEIGEPKCFENGYVNSITIDGIVFRGREIREKLKLRSSAFELRYEGSDIVITTHGFGHGIGLSQYGAEAMAQAGKTYTEILKHYYTGIEISQIGV